MTTTTKNYLYFTVFASGMTTLALELAASRLLGNIFGTSNLVWASIIGLILIYLTAGYFIGGRWADRSPNFRTMYLVLAWAAFLAGLIPVPSGPVLRLAADAFDVLNLGVLMGSFTGVLILFSVPITLLGTISPFAIRLAIQDAQSAGSTAGRIYAVSTLGSFVGTFLPVLFLIPMLGTARTFLVFGLFLNLVALLGLWLTGNRKAALKLAWMPLVLAVLAVLGVRGTIKASEGQIFETESAYNYIQVLEKDDYRLLRLNDGQGVHSMYHPTDLRYGGPWMQFLAAPFYNAPNYDPERVERMAIVGLAAGTTARQATEVFGPIPIDGFEIDPEIIEVGRDYFGMDFPNLNAVAVDGRLGLEQSEEKYTIIGVDAYRPPYIPWHLTTVEFFQLVRERLTDDGTLVINVGRAPQDRSLINGLAGTIRQVFPSIYVVDIPGTFNTILYATVQPTDAQNLFDNLVYLNGRGDVHPLLLEAMQIAVAFRQPAPEVEIVYTDDRAPIEWITNNMVLRFVFFGNLEEIQ